MTEAIFLPRIIPKNTKIKPKILLAKILSKANLYSPVRMSTMVSRAKDENVVKPPKKPVKRNALAFKDILNVSARLKAKPIKKEPRTLTERIPKGKEKSNVFWTHEETP